VAKRRIRDIKQGRVQSASETEKSDSLQHARLAPRVKSFITDTFMIGMPIMYIVVYLVFGSLVEISHDRYRGWEYILPALLLVLTSFMIISKDGQTPGMKAYSLVLRGINTDKSPSDKKPSSMIIFFRQLSSLLSIALFGWVLMFFRKDRRNLHEYLSGTTMVEIDNEVNDGT